MLNIVNQVNWMYTIMAVMTELSFSPVEFAEALNVTTAAVQAWLKGSATPTKKDVDKMVMLLK